MNYIIKDLIGQMSDTLKADALFNGVTIARHVGEVNILLFQNPAYWEGLVQKIPFVLTRYRGRTLISRSSTGEMCVYELEFDSYIGSKSLRTKDEAVEEAETYMAKIFDLWHGRMFYSQKTYADVIPILTGTQITTAGFNQQRSLMAAGGQDERLVIALPEITLYEIRYTARLIA
jgi:hypothetical protein